MRILKRSRSLRARMAVRMVRRAFSRRGASRRGSALLLTLVLTLSLAGLATSAIYLAGNASALATSFDRERDFKYASEAALAIGKSRLNYDPLVVPDSGYEQLLDNETLTGADGHEIPNVTVNMFVGPTSSNTGQFGRFVSVVTEARDQVGARFVRRLELAQESFAKFAYWSDQETNTSGTTIYFNSNDNLWGPVWSNDVIHIGSGGATFHNDVGTAKTIDGKSYGTFEKGYSENQRPITLPNNTVLSNLPGYATAGKLSFTAPNSGDVSNTRMRIEFVAKDINGTGKINDTESGFLRVYTATGTGAEAWLRADWSNVDYNCGAWYPIGPGSPRMQMFIPVSEHAKSWVSAVLQKISFPNWSDFAGSITSTRRQRILSQSSARCYLGGDPRLRAVSLPTTQYNAAVAISDIMTRAQALAGTDTTFVPTGPRGSWSTWTGSIDSRVAAKWPTEKNYLFPLYRGLNTGTKGVIYVNGTVGVSGTLRSRITIYAKGNVAILDDLKYATDPSLGLCKDILGIISSNNIFVVDNALQGPQQVGSNYRSFNDSKDVFIQGIMMAINTSFGAENYANDPDDANGCEGQKVGRGCLYLTGGLIQKARGPVGTSSGTKATGYIKRYSYDRCALYNPPPYFPTTGRYVDNRYYEIDPVHFNVATLYQELTPGP